MPLYVRVQLLFLPERGVLDGLPPPAAGVMDKLNDADLVEETAWTHDNAVADADLYDRAARLVEKGD